MGACFCTGRCRELGYCPVSGGRLPGTVYPRAPLTPWERPKDDDCPYEPTNPKPFDPPRPRQIESGWICPRCGTSNSPLNMTCGNPTCKPKNGSLKDRIKE